MERQPITAKKGNTRMYKNNQVLRNVSHRQFNKYLEAVMYLIKSRDLHNCSGVVGSDTVDQSVSQPGSA